MTSGELTAICPVTAQPDLYRAVIEYWPRALCIESKSLKLYLNGYRNEGHFCEALAVKIRDDFAEVLELPADKVRVTLEQKARGGSRSPRPPDDALHRETPRPDERVVARTPSVASTDCGRRTNVGKDEIEPDAARVSAEAHPQTH